MPARNDGRVIAGFGNEAGGRLLPVIRFLEDEFYSSKAHLTAASLQDMADLAVSDFRRRHPTVTDAIAQYFAWCYTYDFK